MLTQELLVKLAGLDGLIPHEVGTRLAELAATVPPEHAIVEIGSYRGKSTCYLAAGARAGLGAHVFAVDPWDSPGNRTGRFGFADPTTRLAFHQQVATMGLSDRITAFRARSTDLARYWTRPIGLLYIDGSHTEEDVLLDWQAWSPFLAPRWIVAFDDYRTERNPGVARVVDRLMASSAIGATWEVGPAPLVTGRKP